ncbi:hypothetical protein [Desulfoferula mesophila]|uniref:50S ribosomal protein L34e n=1 Tax=Desulfoferula mesophila TaxID=3058419 RepID=A0AAU9EZX5_9BACT|nr:hypothetical protein FAK_02030 [Desulfoferula mesophilus]
MYKTLSKNYRRKEEKKRLGKVNMHPPGGRPGKIKQKNKKKRGVMPSVTLAEYRNIKGDHIIIKCNQCNSSSIVSVENLCEIMSPNAPLKKYAEDIGCSVCGSSSLSFR